MLYDFFLSHAGADGEQAKELYRLLVAAGAEVFVDSVSLQPGQDWQEQLAQALQNSRVVVPLLSSNTKQAHFQRAEILRAINLARQDSEKHILVPVLLDSGQEDAFVPLGMEIFQQLSLTVEGSFNGIKERLIKMLRGRAAWEDYDSLLSIAGYTVAYIPLLNRVGEDVTQLTVDDVATKTSDSVYRLPKAFRATVVDNPKYDDNPSCRLLAYGLGKGNPPGIIPKPRLELTLSQTSYGDYLKSGEHLDDPLPGDKTATFREKFGSLIHEDTGNLRPFPLTNIAGAGVFVINRHIHDGFVIATKHSNSSHIYPGRLTFSASGSLKWGACPHPFAQIIVKCLQEIKHQLNPNTLRLIGFGVDARKLFFHFSFVEETASSFEDVRRRCGTDSEVIKIPLDCDEIVSKLVSGCWEPSAEAALLTLCISQFGLESVTKALRLKSSDWNKRRMLDEWDYRASRAGVLSVMSVRYPYEQLKDKSAHYVNAVVRFIGQDVAGKDVLEIGCGIGRITTKIQASARKVTGVDLCRRMVERAQRALGSAADSVKYFIGFAQDYKTRRHDVVICSLVLVHNVIESDYQGLIKKMCECASTVFVFEDVAAREAASPHTRVRSEKEVIDSFARFGFELERRHNYRLLADDILFAKFSRVARTNPN